MIFINAHNIIQGGGVSVLYSFIDFIDKNEYDAVIVVPNNNVNLLLSKKFTKNSKLHFIYLEVRFLKYLNKFYFNFILFKKLKKRYNFTNIYTIGNIALKSNLSQTVFIQNAFYFTSDPRILKKLSLKFRILLSINKALFFKNLRYASKIIVQTNFIKEILINKHKINSSKIFILPNIINLDSFNRNYVKLETSKRSLLFLSNYYEHKNFNILFKLIPLLAKENTPVEIIITLSETEIHRSGLLNILKMYSGFIRNIGTVSPQDLNDLYNEIDAIFLPSLVESFSTNYVEAIFFKKSIITSDMEFAHEICQDSAFYFNPFDEFSILKAINDFLYDNELVKSKIENYINIELKYNYNEPNKLFKNIINE